MRKISFFVYVLMVTALVCLAGVGLKSTTAKAAATAKTVVPATMNWNDGSALLVPESAKAVVFDKIGNFDFPDAKAQTEHAPKAKPDDKTVKESIDWISARIMQPAWVVPGVTEHWIPMKSWVDELDAFTVRYVVNGYNVQLIYHRLATNVIISPVNGSIQPVSAHGAYIKQMATQVLRIPTTYSFIGKVEGDVSWGALLQWPIPRDKHSLLGENPSDCLRVITDGRFVVMSIGRSYGPGEPQPPNVIFRPLFDQPIEQAAEKLPVQMIYRKHEPHPGIPVVK